MAFNRLSVSVYIIGRERRKFPRSSVADLVVELVVGADTEGLSFSVSEKIIYYVLANIPV
jgi:hypothetical protein